MIAVFMFGNVGMSRNGATVKAADETAVMKKLTFDDFGIEDREYSTTPSYHTAKHLAAGTAFKTLFLVEN